MQALRRRFFASFSFLFADTAFAPFAALCLGSGLLGGLGVVPAMAQPETTLDLLTVDDGDGILQRIYGYDGSGQYGVPLATGHDVDGDGLPDSAFALMTASPNGTRSGEVDLIFGTGILDGSLDTATTTPDFLRIFGAAAHEVAGSEVWIDDVTGDDLGDLLVCRQNFTLEEGASGRVGAGALTILPGGDHLRSRAATLQPLDLGVIPPAFRDTTLVGQESGDRLCIWARTGDVDGDGIADIVVGADQEDAGPYTHRGAVWVVRGGPHLDDGGLVDLAEFGTVFDPLDGHVAHVLPPAGQHLHAGATCNLVDLDGNGRSEVLFAAALNRAGAALPPSVPVGTHATGGTGQGTLYIAWDDLFAADPWPSGYQLTVPSTADPDFTVLDGEFENLRFGEELVGGVDFDGDGDLDLFVGDLQGSPDGRSQAGLGHVIFDAHLLRGQTGDVDDLPGGIGLSRIWGPVAHAIGADTAAVGDFDADGFGDLLFASPHASPVGRTRAGQVHLLFGRDGAWPAIVDLAAPPSPATLRVAQIDGKKAEDVLGYSAAVGDLNLDGRVDLAINEMKGDGPSATDAGNLLLIAGRAFDPAYVFDDGFESGDTSYWSSSLP